MLELKPTVELAAEQLAQYVRLPEPGDIPYPIGLMDETGRTLKITDDHACGGYLLLVFVADFEDDAVRAELTGYREKTTALRRLRCPVVVISALSDAGRNQQFKEQLALPSPVLGDASGGAFAAYGLQVAGNKRSKVKLRSIVLTPYRQIRCIWDLNVMTDHAKRAEELISRAALAEELSWAPPHAPALIIPKVLSTEECELLIAHVESTGPLVINRSQAGVSNSDYKLPAYEHGRQDRIDHVIADPQVLAMLDKRLNERVIPMVKQAFAFDVTRRESLHIARYAGARGGNRMGHRDNQTATFYRRFALSLNLNDNYQGGEVVFREYSSRGYRGAPGAALVFSSSLLHEVEETTEGIRYTLISHFFNDASIEEAKRR